MNLSNPIVLVVGELAVGALLYACGWIRGASQQNTKGRKQAPTVVRLFATQAHVADWLLRLIVSPNVVIRCNPGSVHYPNGTAVLAIVVADERDLDRLWGIKFSSIEIDYDFLRRYKGDHGLLLDMLRARVTL